MLHGGLMPLIHLLLHRPIEILQLYGPDAVACAWNSLQRLAHHSPSLHQEPTSQTPVNRDYAEIVIKMAYIDNCLFRLLLQNQLKVEQITSVDIKLCIQKHNNTNETEMFVGNGVT